MGQTEVIIIGNGYGDGSGNGNGNGDGYGYELFDFHQAITDAWCTHTLTSQHSKG